ncbi:hypothetical protein Tco_1543587, partial [Tanacetum coccineum]
VLTASFILFATYASTMLRMEENVLANWFVCLNLENSVSRVLSLWSNPNKEPKFGRGVSGGGRVVANTRGGSAIVVTRTSTSEVASVLNIESIPVSSLGLSMLEMKLDDTEELYR